MRQAKSRQPGTCARRVSGEAGARLGMRRVAHSEAGVVVRHEAGQRAAAGRRPCGVAPVATAHTRAAACQRIPCVHGRAGHAPGAGAPVCARPVAVLGAASRQRTDSVLQLYACTLVPCSCRTRGSPQLAHDAVQSCLLLPAPGRAGNSSAAAVSGTGRSARSSFTNNSAQG